MQFAVVYSALGRSYVREAAISAWSAKRHMPGAEVWLFTDEPVTCPYFDEVRLVPAAAAGTTVAKASKLNKVHAILSAPPQRVLYVDTDTYFTEDVTGVWNEMGRCSIAAAFDTWQLGDIYRLHNQGLPLNDPPAASPFFNTGVLFVQKSAPLDAFLGAWQVRYRNDGRVVLEQLLFRDMVYGSGLGVHVLPNLYNARIGEVIHLSGRIKIAHFRCGPAWRDSIPFKTDFLNGVLTNRIFCPYDGHMVAMDLMFGRLDRTLSEHVARSEGEAFLHPELSFDAA